MNLKKKVIKSPEISRNKTGNVEKIKTDL